jgi:hypothetical protein
LFLHKIVEVFTEYFKELEEESIRDNYVIIYELLDEMMDFGYPQTTESKILQEYVTVIPSAFCVTRSRIKRRTRIDIIEDTLHKNHTSSKHKLARQLPLQTQSHGEAKGSGIGRTRYSSMSSNRSIFWFQLLETCCDPRSLVPSK